MLALIEDLFTIIAIIVVHVIGRVRVGRMGGGKREREKSYDARSTVYTF